MLDLDESYNTTAGRVAAGRFGSGPTLVLAHGWPWSSFAWHRVVPALAAHFRVHVYDMPGYGHSEMRDGADTGLAAQGRVFTEMLGFWSLDRPAVVAHDIGGAVSLRAHLLHAAEFDRLVLMNVVALSPWGSAFFDHVGAHVDAFTGLPDHIHRAVAEAYMRGALAHPIAEDDLATLLAPWLSPVGRVSFYRQFAQADEAHTAAFEPALGQIRCPTAVLWGEDDPWIPLERGADLAARIGTPLQRLPGLGHLPQLEAPVAVADALLAALGAEAA